LLIAHIEGLIVLFSLKGIGEGVRNIRHRKSKTRTV